MALCLLLVCPANMSGDEDDYLADKFLVEATPRTSAPKTYSQLRKETDKKAKLRNSQNKLKSRRQRELEAREDGLSKSLFERAKEHEEAGISGNKALSMMMKMGFKPGQSLGKTEEATLDPAPNDPAEPHTASGSLDPGKFTATEKVAHSQIVEPIALNEWAGQSVLSPMSERPRV